MTKVSTSPPKRPRPRAPRNDLAPGNALVVPWEQVRLFTQLFDHGGDGSGGGASLAGRKACTQVAMIEALTEQLAPRVVGASQWPLVAVLYLPRLGGSTRVCAVSRARGALNWRRRKPPPRTGWAAYGNAFRMALSRAWACR